MKVIGICRSARKDGNTAALIKTMFEEADGVILGSPVYSASVSSTMQTFIERAAVVCDMNAGILKHKVGASVAAVRRVGGLQAVDTMNHFFLNHEMFVAGSTYWNMAFL